MNTIVCAWTTKYEENMKWWRCILLHNFAEIYGKESKRLILCRDGSKRGENAKSSGIWQKMRQHVAQKAEESRNPFLDSTQNDIQSRLFGIKSCEPRLTSGFAVLSVFLPVLPALSETIRKHDLHTGPKDGTDAALFLFN